MYYALQCCNADSLYHQSSNHDMNNQQVVSKMKTLTFVCIVVLFLCPLPTPREACRRVTEGYLKGNHRRTLTKQAIHEG